MSEIPASTLQAAWNRWRFSSQPPTPERMETALQAALDEGGVVLTSKFQDVCDYLLAWTGFNEYALVNVNTMDQLVPKFRYDELCVAAQAVLDTSPLSSFCVSSEFREARKLLKNLTDNK